MESLSSGKSRFTYADGSRYAPEGDALVVAEALDKARFFVLECSDLIVAVDHRPLLEILGDRSLDVITNTRLRNTNENNRSGGRAVERRTVNRGDGGSIPPAVSKLRQFRSPHIACVFRKIHKKPVVPSIWCLRHGK